MPANKKVETKPKLTAEEELYGYIPASLCEFCQKKENPEDEDPDKIDEIIKRKYLVQIDELTKRTDRMAGRLDQLVVRASLYPPKIEQIAADQKDIVEYITRNIDNADAEYKKKFDESEKLNKEYEQLFAVHEKILEEERLKIDKFVEEFTPKIAQLEEEIGKLKEDEDDMIAVYDRLAVIDVEYEKKSAEHVVDMYERGKDIVREVLEIRAKIPDWVKNVTAENKEIASRKLRFTINSVRLETVNLLGQYIGRPNETAKAVAAENARLVKQTGELKRRIDVMNENLRILTKENDGTVLGIRTVAIDMKRNRELVLQFARCPENDPQITENLKKNVANCRKKKDKALRTQMEYRAKLEHTDSKTEFLDKDKVVLQSVLAICRDSLYKILDKNVHKALLDEIDELSCMSVVSDETRHVLTKYIPCSPLTYDIHSRLPVARPPSH